MQLAGQTAMPHFQRVTSRATAKKMAFASDSAKALPPNTSFPDLLIGSSSSFFEINSS
jgi:hypothetical protein